MTGLTIGSGDASAPNADMVTMPKTATMHPIRPMPGHADRVGIGLSFQFFGTVRRLRRLVNYMVRLSIPTAGPARSLGDVSRTRHCTNELVRTLYQIGVNAAPKRAASP